MTAATTPVQSRAVAPADSFGWIVRRLPSLVETLCTLAAIALLLPAFQRVADAGGARDDRFADPGARVQGLPAPVLPAACASFGVLAQPLLRERLCPARRVEAAARWPDRWPPVLSDALARAKQAFLEPVQSAQARLTALRVQQREGLGELRGLSDAIAGIEAETQPLIDRFQLIQGDDPGPAPLVCAGQRVEAAFAAAHDDASANAALLLAAALDGHPATEPLAGAALLPAAPVQVSAACAGMDLPQALGGTAALMSGARQALLDARKNEATRELLRTAGWQWAGAMLLGLVLLKWSRHRVRPATGAAVAMLLWAAAAWAGRVPWPLGGGRAFEPGRIDADPLSPPALFVVVLAGVGALALIVSLARPQAARPAPQALSSRVGYPGLGLATGVGWLLLLDLSAHAHLSNRYLALYHQGHLWLAMLVFSLMLFLRQPLARALGWALSIAGEAGARLRRRLGVVFTVLLVAAASAALVVAVGLVLSNMRQLTSELGRVWVIVGAAWFFFLRGDPLAERLARSGRAGVSVLRYVGPLLLVAAVLVGFMLVTRDMGPLLIAGYGAGAFIAASVAMWWHQRSGQRLGALLLAVLLFGAWIVFTTTALFRLGSVDAVTAARLESLAAPLASSNDQLALVSWFQHAAPREGFGIGAVPWCGYAATSRCGGVPAQIHSDYTFTAIVGMFGTTIAWVAALGSAWWLHRLVRHHGRVTRGEPRLVSSSGRLVHDAQAFMSWIAVAWVVSTLCQLAVTVAGNLAVLPLTGVTFPFVSFGMTSLVVNAAFLGLAINVNVSARDDHG